MTRPTNRHEGCLFCGNETGKFTSEEHVIPASLGNDLDSGLVEKEIVLPRGVVCDKCNGRRLQDRALCEWPPVSVFRSLGLIPNRRRNLVEASRNTAWRADVDPSDPRNVRIRAEASTDETTRRDDVARALCKIALETRWLDDPVDARSLRWDRIAAAAIRGALPASLAMGLIQPFAACDGDIDLRPSSELVVADAGDDLRLACKVYVVGLLFVLTIGVAPPRTPDVGWWSLDADTGSLIGPNSMWSELRGRAERAVPLTATPPDMPAGKSIILPTGDEKTHIQISPSSTRRL